MEALILLSPEQLLFLFKKKKKKQFNTFYFLSLRKFYTLKTMKTSYNTVQPTEGVHCCMKFLTKETFSPPSSCGLNCLMTIEKNSTNNRKLSNLSDSP